MMHRWPRARLSCRNCHEKKRRCDRKRPCSSCTLRGISCDATSSPGPDGQIGTRGVAASAPPKLRTDDDDVLQRLRRLEDAVFRHGTEDATQFVPFTHHVIETPSESNKTLKQAALQLPPLHQARILLDHLAKSVHSYWAILHLPTCRDTLERLYPLMMRGDEPPVTDLLVLLACFASAAFTGTSLLLRNLNATEAEARAAHITYMRLATALLEDRYNPVTPSAASFAATATVFTLTTHTTGMYDACMSLRMRCHAMAQQMQVNRLDSKKSRDERLLKGCNAIEVEMQRRVWWHLVGHDWLSAFSGSPLDGTYLLHPKHMNIRLPSNTNDEYVTPTGITKEFPLNEPTSMTAFHYRIKLAEICREVVDVMPVFDDALPAYETVLAMDKKFQDFLNEIPVFMRIDDKSIAQSVEICKRFPSMPLLRAGLHLSVHTRLCRLHRPYHLEGVTDKKYAYSHDMCLRAAQAVLDTRRALDVAGKPLGVNPARSWVVMQHVFVAGLILATDVSFNPHAPDAERRKTKVLAICDILEKSVDETGAGMDGVQRNMQVLISTLQGGGDSDLPTAPVRPPMDVDRDLTADLATGVDFDQLWSEFMAIAPDLEIPQWDLVFGDVNAALEL